MKEKREREREREREERVVALVETLASEWVKVFFFCALLRRWSRACRLWFRRQKKKRIREEKEIEVVSIHIIPRFVSAPLQRVPLVHMESKRQAAARLRSPSDELPLSLSSLKRDLFGISLFFWSEMSVEIFLSSIHQMQQCNLVTRLNIRRTIQKIMYTLIETL